MLRMLIADDHPIVSERIRQMLSEEFPAAFFVVANNTDSLISEAQSQDWDIVISDLVMPGGGGLHALKKIKQTKPTLPFIIISVYPEEQYIARAIQDGAEAFINKNSAGDELVVTVKRILHAKLNP
jgi:DNA-binding NarL/FixJ family response regulator